MDRAPRVLALTGDETGCSLWRVWQPFAELEKRGFIAEWCHKDDSDKILPVVAAGRYDAIITPRIVWRKEGVGDRWLRAIRRAGLAWIYEVDDDVFSPRIVDRQSNLFENEAARGKDQLEWERRERIRFMSDADGITVTTQRLATQIKRYVPDANVYVVPNAIDAKWFRDTLRGCTRVPELKGKLTIGWAGGNREDVDVIPLAESWSVLAKKFQHVMFVVQGHIPKVLAECVPQDRRLTLPWVALPEYPRAMLNADIGCCCVAPMVFNTSKSAIKWYEYTLAGAACVVSDTVYGKEVTPYHDALVATTTEEWIAHLSALVESDDLRRTIQHNARYTVMTQHTLQTNWWRWPAAWSDAIDRFRSKPQLVLASA